MRILFVEPNAEPRAIEIDGSLASMQALSAVSSKLSTRSKTPSP